MDCPIHIDNIKMELSILYIKGSLFTMSKLGFISVPDDVFIFFENYAVLMKYRI